MCKQDADMEYMKSKRQRSPTNRNFWRSFQSRKQLTCWKKLQESRIRETTKAKLDPNCEFETSVVHGAENPFIVGSVEEHLTIDTGSNISIMFPMLVLQ